MMRAPDESSTGHTRRLAGKGSVNRERVIRFTFDGREYTGFAGDTLASALLANGVSLVGRSFKYHRPRGILCAGSEEPNALVELRTGARREPNTRATMVELFDGLVAFSQNRWPSLSFDVGAVNSLFAPLLVAGFYYKTFKWPASFWERLYEPAIRRAAGLGHAAHAPDPDRYEHVNAFCDVLVIGGGVAGLSAAWAAAQAGKRVIIADEHAALGGQLLGSNETIAGVAAQQWLLRMRESLDACGLVTVLPRTTVFGVYDGHTYGAAQRVADHVAVPLAGEPRQRLWKIVAPRAVLASGAIEQPLTFAGNDRPGVMMAAAVRMYLNRFGVVAGSQPVIVTTNESGWRLAEDLVEAGVRPVAVIDLRAEVPEADRAAAERAGLRVLAGARVLSAQGARRVRSVTLLDASGRRIKLSCDLLAMSGGWNPSLALTTYLGGKPVWSETLGAFVAPDVLPPGMVLAGAANALFDTEAALAGTSAAQRTAAHVAPAAVAHAARPTAPRASLAQVENRPLLLAQAFGNGKAFVDFQHDVTSEDIALAHREGFRSVEHLKRYTTLGMATDQGKLSNINGLALMAACSRRGIAGIGTTLARPPYTPVSIGLLAGADRGRHFKPTRLTSGHRWAEENGATFTTSGQWLRAQWFARPGETDWLSSVIREVKAVRAGVGVCDVSTLGKIDVQGSDAARLLDRVYINMFSTLPVGKARYGLMLREDGFAFDDGTTARLADDHYVMSTTTANAARVMQHLEFACQVSWPDLDVQLASVTEQWAQYAIAGPQSRAVLQQLLGDAVDLGDEAFPYMACGEFVWRDLTVRLFRLSFSGERAYELAVPARYGDAVIRAIMQAGEHFGITPYGIEAMSVMRIEKGHVAGNELNGTTTAADLGMGRMMSKKKDFIGAVLSRRAGLTDASRAALVGLRPLDPASRLRAGAHLLAPGAAATMDNDLGYITSAAYSPQFGHWIALAMLVHAAQRLGERLRVFDAVRGADVEVEVCSPVFIDAEGARLHA
ncbi:sarcosine oxidase subunit alpha family protein [Paraburkholderia sp. ZP32-5]|uniref:sarcosine oxidase subunit alpha family protein n=1 Tax=Paraburkholderia sp. ZP32-5 TaxID=2883245 RepID=UPI001F2C8259|nr:sarcosine oxidase subunit alpha family protein [Paraburkholderia sp. ZP32-5]